MVEEKGGGLSVESTRDIKVRFEGSTRSIQAVHRKWIACLKDVVSDYRILIGFVAECPGGE
eukprot:5640230-Amphidinium_carterae.1